MSEVNQPQNEIVAGRLDEIAAAIVELGFNEIVGQSNDNA